MACFGLGVGIRHFETGPHRRDAMRAVAEAAGSPYSSVSKIIEAWEPRANSTFKI